MITTMVLTLVTAGLSTATIVGAPPATAANTFQGNVELMDSPAPGQVRVAGWMFDEDVPTVSISYHVYVGGSGAADSASYGVNMGTASIPRDDVARNYPHAGPHHGFSGVLDVPLHGSQPVYVYAIDGGGPSATNQLLAVGTVVIADVPPETTITTRPPTSGTATAVSFGFTATEASTFRCRLDQAAWAACTSPTTMNVSVGAHTFAVMATNSAGTPDPSPATYAFTVVPPPAPPVVEPPVVEPPPPPRITVRLRAVVKKRKPLRLRIDIGPDLDPSNYRFTVQRKSGTRWRAVVRTQTLGPKDVSVLRLPRGRYRVVVPRQHGMTGASATIRLRR